VLRALLVFTSLLFSLYVSAAESPNSHAMTTNGISHSALLIEAPCTIPDQVEKLFLTSPELAPLSLTGGVVVLCQHSPSHCAQLTNLHNRSPPV